METLKQAASLNNEAVILLQHNQTSLSIDKLHQALTIVHDGAESTGFVPPSPGVDARPPGVDDGPSSTLSCLESLSGWVRQCHESVYTSSNTHSYVYGRPFIITTHLTPSNEAEYVSSLAFVGSHLLFNCALAYMKLADTSGSHAAARRASDLYQSLLEMVYFRVAQLGGNDKAHAALMCLAFNNMAYLHYEQCQYQESVTCIDAMLFMVHDIDKIDEYFFPDELAGLLLNVEYARVPANAGAA